MGKDTEISWCDHTFNGWWGCQRVSDACRSCYAETFSRRIGGSPWAKGEHWGPNSLRTPASDKVWNDPIRWNMAALKAGVRRRVFCASMADVFEARDDLDPLRARLWTLIESTPALDWLLLTKRPEEMVRRAPDRWADGWPPNVWAGTTVEDQQRADERIPALLRVPARVRFLSCEPLLGPVTLGAPAALGGEREPWLGYQEWWSRYVGPCGCERARDPWDRCDDCVERGWVPDPVRGIAWVIAGGESGAKARPMHPTWARSLRDQCNDADVPFLFKQWGEWVDLEGAPTLQDAPDGARHEWFDGEVSLRVGKAVAGALLDGVAHNGFPVSS